MAQGGRHRQVSGGVIVTVVVTAAVAVVLGRAGSDGSAQREVEASAGEVAVGEVSVVDGDTLRLRSGERVRLIGIDAPEQGRCGAETATRALRELVAGQRVVLTNPDSVQDRDRFDRLLRYVEVDGRDAGFLQLRQGLARARYDGLDGYDPHPRQPRYRAAAGAAPARCG